MLFSHILNYSFWGFGGLVTSLAFQKEKFRGVCKYFLYFNVTNHFKKSRSQNERPFPIVSHTSRYYSFIFHKTIIENSIPGTIQSLTGLHGEDAESFILSQYTVHVHSCKHHPRTVELIHPSRKSPQALALATLKEMSPARTPPTHPVRTPHHPAGPRSPFQLQTNSPFHRPLLIDAAVPHQQNSHRTS